MSFHVTPRRARVIGALASIVAAGALAAPGASLAAGIPGPPGDPLPDGAVPGSAGPGGLHHAAPSVGSVTFHRGGAHLVLPGTGPTSGRAGGLTGGKVGMPTDDGTGPNNPVADDDGNGGTAPSDGNGNGNGNGDGSGSGNGSGGNGGGNEPNGGGNGGGEPVPGSTPDVIASPPPDTRKASEQVTEAMKTIVDYAYKARTGDVTAEDQHDALEATLTLSANGVDMDGVQEVADAVYNGNYDGAANAPTTPSAQDLSKDFPELFPPAGHGREAATDDELQKLMDDATPWGSSQPTNDMGDLDPRTPGEQVTESLKTLIDLTTQPGPVSRQDRIDGLNAVLTLDKNGIDLNEVGSILNDIAAGNHGGAPGRSGGGGGKKKGSGGDTTSSSRPKHKP